MYIRTHNTYKGSSRTKKTVKKADIVCFGRPPPPKRVKSGHLLSDYRQKCVNGTRDNLMLKARKITILAILWCQKSLFGPYLVHIWPYLAILWCQ